MNEQWTGAEVSEFARSGRTPARLRTSQQVCDADPVFDRPATNSATKRGSSPRGTMNKNEGRYAFDLELQKRSGLIRWYAFEPMTIKLAKRTRYTPDFLIQRSDGTLEFIEVKGRKGERYWATEDSKIKVKVAAQMYPMFRFAIVWQRKDGAWMREDFSPQ